MMRKMIFCLIFLLTSCGQQDFSDPETMEKVDVGNTDTFAEQFKFKACGKLSWNQGLTGGSTGFFLQSTAGNKYFISSDHQRVTDYLNKLNTTKTYDVCVYSPEDASQGYESLIIKAQAITEQ